VQALKTLFPYNANDQKFLWLNSSVKFKCNPLYIDEFIDSGVFFHTQLLNDNNNYLTFTDFARKFEFVSD